MSKKSLKRALVLNDSWLCLDFVNTKSWRGSAAPGETLHGYQDVVAWVQRTRAVSASQAAALLKLAKRHPARTQRALGQALALREALYNVLAAASAGAPMPQHGLATLNAVLSQALSRLQLFIDKKKEFALNWDYQGLELAMWPVIWSAAQLLTSPQLARVGRCANPACGWMFFDTSKNRSRRWCSMNTCGNRAKVHHFRERQRDDPS